jgi:hypothetical protein
LTKSCPRSTLKNTNFWRNMCLLSSGLKSTASKQQVCCYQIVRELLPYYIMPHFRRQYSSQWLLWAPLISHRSKLLINWCSISTAGLNDSHIYVFYLGFWCTDYIQIFSFIRKTATYINPDTKVSDDGILLKWCFEDWGVSLSFSKKSTLLGHIDRASPSPDTRMKTQSEMSFQIKIMMD